MKAVNHLLALGLSHREIIQKAPSLGIDVKKAQNYLANVADAPLIKENRPAIMTMQVYMLVLNCLAMGSLAWLGWHEQETFYYIMAGAGALFTAGFWYGISKNRASAYVAVCYLTGLASLQALRGMKEAPGIILMCVLLNIVLIAMAVRLKLRLFPHQNFFNTKKRQDGCLCY